MQRVAVLQYETQGVFFTFRSSPNPTARITAANLSGGLDGRGFHVTRRGAPVPRSMERTSRTTSIRDSSGSFFHAASSWSPTSRASAALQSSNGSPASGRSDPSAGQS